MVIKCHVPRRSGDAPSDYVVGANWSAYARPRNNFPPVSLMRRPNWTAGFYYYYVVEEAPVLTDAERAKRCIEDYNYLKDQGWAAHGQNWAGAKIVRETPSFRLVKFSKTTITEIP